MAQKMQISFFSQNFLKYPAYLNVDTFFHIFPINMPSRFLSFFLLNFIFHLILRNYIRPPGVFKIPSAKFQWTQTIEEYLVERSAYAMILGNNTKFLVNYLYVAGSNLGHLGDFIITSLLNNYY